MTRDATNRMYRDSVGTIVNMCYLSESCREQIFKVTITRKETFLIYGNKCYLVVITLQYTQLSNNYVVHLNMFYVNYISKRVSKYNHASMGTWDVKPAF